MKKIALFIFLALSTQNFTSQIVFCPAGAEWRYSFNVIGLSSNYVENETIMYAGDSVVNNENLKILSHKRFFKQHNMFNVSRSLLKQKGDTVFVKNQCTLNKWQILYNFAALPGQNWTIVVYPFLSTPGLFITYTVSVDSVSLVNINNFNLKRLHVKYSSSHLNSTAAAVITERLGCEAFMFNYRNSLITSGDWLQDNLCYQDSVFGLKQFTVKPCNYTDAAGLLEKNYQKADIKICPNPTADFFTISHNNKLISGSVLLAINDLCGGELKQMTINNLNSTPTEIDISDLPKGIYILNLSNKNEIIYTGKLIKSD